MLHHPSVTCTTIPLFPRARYLLTRRSQRFYTKASFRKFRAHYILPVGVVPKKQNKLRLILDCRFLNKHIACCTFKQEGIEAVPHQIEWGDYLVSVDLEAGFHHIKINPFFRKYICFSWRDKTYCWNVLPFGLKSAPYIFYKVLRPVVLYLRTLQIRNCVFVDDFIFMLKKLCAQDQLDTSLHVLHDCGWNINWGKSDLTFTTSCDFVGFTVFSDHPVHQRPWITVQAKKLRKLRKLLRVVLNNTHIVARRLARIAGQCIAMCHAVLPAKLLLQNVYRLLGERTGWDSLPQLDAATRRDLEWWLNVATLWNGAQLVPHPITAQVWTDASQTGWGGWYETNHCTGTWTQDVQQCPSNYRELLAIYRVLLSLGDKLTGHSIQVLSDNITAYLNDMGGQILTMSALVQNVFVHCQAHQIELVAKYFAGKKNVLADRLSRIMTHYEFALYPRLFHLLDSMWGPHTVDRFASEQFHQVPRYNSLYLDPGTEAVDALSQSWASENNFVNVPFILLDRVVRKIKQDQCSATVIAPRWKGRPWLLQLQKMSMAPPLRLPNCRTVFLGNSLENPCRNPKWKLFAWRVCGKNA